MRIRIVPLCIALSFLVITVSASAKSKYLMEFKEEYSKATKIAKCALCHDEMPSRNYFGYDFEKAKHDFAAIEALDSDGDGVKNIDEINANTYPGDKESH
ncbi:MAG: hypothetical protein HYW49_02800 [Deltaproteobacteria bacterium]|nr:hypothetical protein [Deltaproteobacteria bacterium]